MTMQNHFQDHIELIAKHEQEFLENRTRAERVGDAIAGFAGSFAFVGLHLVVFAGWIVWNTVTIPHLWHFDPAPFSLLGVVVGLEAILLASIILMRQSRVSRRSDERDHLMLQVLLLTEREITAVLKMDRQIAEQVGMTRVANEREVEQLSKKTSIDAVAQTIKEALPSE
jgi:uncharacterized membrane protein